MSTQGGSLSGDSTPTEMGMQVEDLLPPIILQDELLALPSEQVSDQNLCWECDRDAEWFCSRCDDQFCSACFDAEPAHRADLDSNRKRPRARPRRKEQHERVEFKIYSQLSEIFEPKSSQKRDNLFEWEIGAKWFYVSRAENGDFRLGNTNRFRELTSPRWGEHCPEQFPSLISFVGQTGNKTSPFISLSETGLFANNAQGMGKSTLVRMLIALNDLPENHDGIRALYPVTASPDSTVLVPTTGDVQLYPDHPTYGTRAPLLFADCEGLDGGDQEPQSLKSRGSRYISARSRKIAWATGTSGLSREDVISDLFTKVLYTFSDVVVFVLKNPGYVSTP